MKRRFVMPSFGILGDAVMGKFKPMDEFRLEKEKNVPRVTQHSARGDMKRGVRALTRATIRRQQKAEAVVRGRQEIAMARGVKMRPSERDLGLRKALKKAAHPHLT